LLNAFFRIGSLFGRTLCRFGFGIFFCDISVNFSLNRFILLTLKIFKLGVVELFLALFVLRFDCSQ